MPHTQTILKVEDYAKWKSGFDGHRAKQKAAGQKTYQIFRTEDDPNKIVVLAEWDNLDNAREFLQSQELQEAMQQAGVIGKPDICLLEEVDKGSI